jgi:hypothetical protein
MIVKGWQKFLLYVLLFGYFAVPIIQIYYCSEIISISDKKEKIDKALLNNTKSYSNTNNYNNCEDLDCEEKNDKSASKNNDKEFQDLFGTYDFIKIPFLNIIIIIISWNFLMISFICLSYMEGTQCAATCCMCCGEKNLPNCVKTITECAIYHPLIVQCILEVIIFILVIVELVYSKKMKSIIPDIYKEIYNDMVIFEKDFKICIVFTILIILFSIGYKILDKYYFNKAQISQTIHVVPVMPEN